MQGSYTSILSHALAPNSPQTILIYLQITHTKSNFSLTIYNFIQKLNLLCSRLLKQHRITNETTKRRIRHKLNFNIKKGKKNHHLNTRANPNLDQNPDLISDQNPQLSRLVPISLMANCYPNTQKTDQNLNSRKL